MKHAYCIIAHNRPDLLQNLVEMIDDERNDIFIHIDKKSDIAQFSHIKAEKSHLQYTSKRVDCIWGNVSQIYTEMQLFEDAMSCWDYDYVHLLSGIDVPIKSQDYIHSFINGGGNLEYIGYLLDSDNQRLLRRRTEIYHVLTQKGRTGLGKFYGLIRKAFCALQRIIGYKRKHTIKEFGIGPNWVSLTGACIKYILSQKDVIYKEFQYTTCIDEVYKHSILLNSPFRDKIYRYGDGAMEGCMRLIDWTRGRPYVFQMHDIDEIMSSDRLFCRKVTDLNLAKEIRKRIEFNENTSN